MGTNYAYAKENDVTIPVENLISVKENISIYGKEVPLYVTFDSNENALESIKDNKAVEAIKEAYQLDNISEENWKKYYEDMYKLMDSDEKPDWYGESNADVYNLMCFFDIYENEEKNEQIETCVNDMNKVRSSEINTDLLLLLPYGSYEELSDYLENDIDSYSNARSIVKGFDTSKGIAYANKYATSPNTASYKKFNSDCTNFASQILENGGVAQVKYNDENKGWWHTKSGSSHSHSISWIRADTFAKYMGVNYTTKNNKVFSGVIQAGDFIAADFTDDQDWDHIGFVTDKKIH